MTNRTTRNRRLRKKLYLDEFKVMGFDFSCTINYDSEEKYDAFLERFADLAEERNLIISIGGEDNHFEGFVSSGERYGSATDDDIKAVTTELAAHDIISEVVIGDLIDAYYGD